MNDFASRVLSLGDVCRVRSGYASRGALPDGVGVGTLTVQQGDLTPNGEYVRAGAVRTSLSTHSLQHYASNGEVLFRSRGPYWSAWEALDLDEPLLALAPLFILRPVSDVLDPGYLRWALMQPASQRYFASEATGTGVKMITKALLERLPLEVPALIAQRLVAEAARLADRERALATELAGLRHKDFTARIANATHSNRKIL